MFQGAVTFVWYGCRSVCACYCFLQKIEAPVREGNSADKSYAYGGKSIGDRQSDVDRLLVDQNEPEEKRFLGTEVAFPDALRFKGAAPEVANSRYMSSCSSKVHDLSVFCAASAIYTTV